MKGKPDHCGNISSSIYKKKMISAFYKFSPSRKEKITRQTNNTPPFIIPSQHLLDNAADILRLKKQCLSTSPTIQNTSRSLHSSEIK